MRTAGVSTCPICKMTWTVTPETDCFMPACGCYGTDGSADNPNRPCEPCGLTHVYAHRGMVAPPLVEVPFPADVVLPDDDDIDGPQ